MFTLPLKNAEGNFTRNTQILENTPLNGIGFRWAGAQGNKLSSSLDSLSKTSARILSMKVFVGMNLGSIFSHIS